MIYDEPFRSVLSSINASSLVEIEGRKRRALGQPWNVETRRSLTEMIVNKFILKFIKYILHKKLWFANLCIMK